MWCQRYRSGLIIPHAGVADTGMEVVGDKGGLERGGVFTVQGGKEACMGRVRQPFPQEL